MMLKGILAALAIFGAPKEIATDLGPAIARYAQSPDEAAFLISWAESESHFSADIAADRCARWECDAHRRHDGSIEHLARGLFQLHRGAAGIDWDALPGDVDAQARSASRMARWALKTCKTPVGAFRMLGGLGCDRPLKGEEKRVASYARALRML
jgi:hypothetical protein